MWPYSLPKYLGRCTGISDPLFVSMVLFLLSCVMHSLSTEKTDVPCAVDLTQSMPASPVGWLLLQLKMQENKNGSILR